MKKLGLLALLVALGLLAFVVQRDMAYTQETADLKTLITRAQEVVGTQEFGCTEELQSRLLVAKGAILKGLLLTELGWIELDRQLSISDTKTHIWGICGSPFAYSSWAWPDKVAKSIRIGIEAGQPLDQLVAQAGLSPSQTQDGIARIERFLANLVADQEDMVTLADLKDALEKNLAWKEYARTHQLRGNFRPSDIIKRTLLQ